MLIDLLNNVNYWIIFYFVMYSWFVLVYASSRLRNKLFQKTNVFKHTLTGIISIMVFLGLPTLIVLLEKEKPKNLPYYFHLIGLTLIAIAICIEVVSRWQIGPFPGLRKKGTLITGGIYKIVRHPIYLGNSLLIIGLAIFFYSKTALIFSILYFISYSPLIILEEKILLEEYRKEYQEYKRNTPYILIPKIF